MRRAITGMVAVASVMVGLSGVALAQSSARELTAAEQEAVEKAVKDSLKDPESARFGTMLAVDAEGGMADVCGYVNARNSFGGYVGDTPFLGMLVKANNRNAFALLKLGDDDLGATVVHQLCAEKGIGL